MIYCKKTEMVSGLNKIYKGHWALAIPMTGLNTNFHSFGKAQVAIRIIRGLSS